MTVRLRGGTAAQWTAANPVLAAREIGVETTTRRIKVGDGSTAWLSLPYYAGWSSGVRNITAELTFDATLHGSPSPTVHISRTGHLVVLDASWRVPNPIPAAAGTLFTVPAGWRPAAMPGGGVLTGQLGNLSSLDTAAGAFSVNPSTGAFTVRGLAAGQIVLAHIVYASAGTQPTSLPGTEITAPA